MAGTGRNLSHSAMRSAMYRNPKGPAKYFAPYRIRKHINEIVMPDDLNVNDLTKLKSGLNGKIWEKGGRLKNEIREKLLEIAKEFYKYLGFDYPVKDIYLTGSLANYNWTSQSDLDVHVLFDLEDEEESELMSEYVFAKKDLWSNKHDITIFGFPVELFAKNIEPEHGSKAIYSLVKNQWVKKPSKKNISIDEHTVKLKAAELMNKIDDLESIKDNTKKYEFAEKLKEKIRKMRQSSLESGGEFSNENLAFKVLRNGGYLEKLDSIKTKAFDNELSLNEGYLFEDASDRFKYGCLMLGFDIPNWDKILGQIKKEDVYEGDRLGLQSDPHITLLFGFHDDEVDPEDVKNKAKKYIKKPLPVYVDGVSVFSSDKMPYDVLKFDVESKELEKTNIALRKFPHTSNFKDYHPHMTIAYVKKGMGSKYAQKFEEPLKLTGKELIYSHPDRSVEEWSLIKRNILKVQNDIPGMTDEKIEIIKDFINFTCDKLKMKEPVTVVLRKGRDEYITTTASYLPNENENHIKCGGRALVDCLRSIGHELAHNRQREIGVFKKGEEVPNIGYPIEDQANAIAGVLIKDFSHNYGYDSIYILEMKKNSNKNIL